MTKTLRNILTASIAVMVMILSACSATAVSPATNPSSLENSAVSIFETQSSEIISSENEITASAAVITGFGSKTALTDPNLTLASMLTYAIQDEYLAHAEYLAILDTYGNQNPFSNIVKAEESHISALTPLFAEYDIALPIDDAADRIILPKSITDALEIGVVAEIDNIDMYQLFLEQDIPDDVKAVFTNLMKASESHLAAFKNALGR